MQRKAIDFFSYPITNIQTAGQLLALNPNVKNNTVFPFVISITITTISFLKNFTHVKIYVDPCFCDSKIPFGCYLIFRFRFLNGFDVGSSGTRQWMFFEAPKLSYVFWGEISPDDGVAIDREPFGAHI